MSFVASPDAGGDSPIKQTGTAPAANEPVSYPSPISNPDAGIADACNGAKEQTDVDLLFGGDDDVDFETVLSIALHNDSNNSFAAQDDLLPSSVSHVSNNNNNGSAASGGIAHDDGDQSGSDHHAGEVRASQPASPIVAPKPTIDGIHTAHMVSTNPV